jgi:hypothetical protein
MMKRLSQQALGEDASSFSSRHPKRSYINFCTGLIDNIIRVALQSEVSGGAATISSPNGDDLRQPFRLTITRPRFHQITVLKCVATVRLPYIFAR